MSAICKTCEKREFQPGRDVHSVCGVTKEHVWGYVQMGTASKKCPINNGDVKVAAAPTPTTTAAPATTTPAPTEAPATTTAAPAAQEQQQEEQEEQKAPEQQAQVQTTTAAPLFNNGMKLGQQPQKRK